MTTTIPVTIPTELQTFIHSMAQKVFTALSTIPAVYAVVGPEQTQFVAIGVSIVMFLAGILWTWLRTKADTARNVNLANAKPPPEPIPPRPSAPVVVMAPIPN